MLYRLEFDIWMVNEKSLAVLPFEPSNSYSKFIVSMWMQTYNGRNAFNISLRNTHDASHIKTVIRENISLSTARYFYVICLTKTVFLINGPMGIRVRMCHQNHWLFGVLPIRLCKPRFKVIADIKIRIHLCPKVLSEKKRPKFYYPWLDVDQADKHK